MQKVSIFNYTVSNKASEKSCDVYIDGVIVDAETQSFYEMYYGDTTLASFKSVRDQINQFISEGCNVVNVNTNSMGGSVIEAFAMKDYFDSLVVNGIKVNKICMGLAASAATLFISGKGSSISKNSWYMIHNVSGGIYGNVNEIENYYVTIRDFNNQILSHYESVTGLSKSALEAMMNNETWITGEDAVKLGFVESLIDSSSNITNQIKPENWMYQNKSVLAAYNSITQTPINMDTKTIINGVKDAFVDSLKQAGIIKDDNTKLCDTLTNALDAALAPMNDGITNAVNDAVTERLKNMDTNIQTAVENALKESNKDLLTAQALEDKLKPITENINALQDKVNGDAGSAQPELKEGEEVTALNHPGIKW